MQGKSELGLYLLLKGLLVLQYKLQQFRHDALWFRDPLGRRLGVLATKEHTLALAKRGVVAYDIVGTFPLKHVRNVYSKVDMCSRGSWNNARISLMSSKHRV
jgi:hypothetical protein